MRRSAHHTRRVHHAVKHIISRETGYIIAAHKSEPHGGNNRARTCDPLLVRQVLSQLSYAPLRRLNYNTLFYTACQEEFLFFLRNSRKTFQKGQNRGSAPRYAAIYAISHGNIPSHGRIPQRF